MIRNARNFFISVENKMKAKLKSMGLLLLSLMLVIKQKHSGGEWSSYCYRTNHRSESDALTYMVSFCLNLSGVGIKGRFFIYKRKDFYVKILKRAPNVKFQLYLHFMSNTLYSDIDREETNEMLYL